MAVGAVVLSHSTVLLATCLPANMELPTWLTSCFTLSTRPPVLFEHCRRTENWHCWFPAKTLLAQDGRFGASRLHLLPALLICTQLMPVSTRAGVVQVAKPPMKPMERQAKAAARLSNCETGGEWVT